MIAVEIHHDSYHAAFTLEGGTTGELLECVDRNEDGTWDWSAASICDARGDDPDFQDILRVSLAQLTAYYERPRST